MKPLVSNKYNTIIYLTSALVILIGITVVFGWVMDIKILRTIKNDYVSMKFNTAIAFIIGGISLFYCAKNKGKRSVAVNIFICVLFLLPALTLTQDIFGYNAGIDEILMTDIEKSAKIIVYPGRMSPLSATCFILFSIYLAFYNSADKTYRSISQWLLHLVTLLSFIAIVGYFFGVPVFYKLAFITSIAAHTAFCFFILSIAASLINPSLGITGLFTGASIGSVMARKIFLQMALAVLLLGYGRILLHKFNMVGVEFGIGLFATSFILVSLFLVWRVSRQLNAIDEKKQEAEGNLSKIQTFLDATPDPIVIADSEGTISLSNKEAEKVFGYEKDELKGKNIAQLIPKRLTDETSGNITNLLTSLKQGELNTGSNMFALKKDGTEFPVEITTNSLSTKEGTFISTALRDISNLTRQEKEIKAMANIIADSSDAIFSRAITGTILSWNKGATKLFGYEPQEIIGQKVAVLFPDVSLQTRIELTKQVLANQSVEKYETTAIKKDRTVITVSITMSPVLDDMENITAISLILRDITQQKAAEKLLIDSSERNKLFIQQSPNAIAMFDKDMRYLAASKKWVTDYHLSGKEIIGHSHYEIFPEIGDDWKAIHQQGLQGQINQCDEAYFERADGSVQWLTWDVRPWYITEGEIGGLLMYTADITTQKQKEKDKNNIEEILDKTNEVARIGTWEVDLVNNKITWSRITKEIHEVAMDYEPELTTAIEFFKEGKSRTAIENAVNEAISNGTTYDLELELLTAKGNTVWARAIGQAEFKNGICQRLFGVFQDINESVQSKQALQKLNSELDTLLNAGYVSIIGTDSSGIITHFNKGAEMLLQYTASEMIGINSPEIIHVKEEVVKRGIELKEQFGYEIAIGFDVFVETAKRGEFDSREWTYIRKDGTGFPVQLVVTAVKNKQGEIIGFLGIATDISQLKEAEQKLVASNESINSVNRLLNQKNEELEQFAYVAAHDLQEPLRMISSFLTLLDQRYALVLDDKGKQYISFAVDGAIRMRDLINDILDFSSAGIVNNQLLNLNNVVNDIAAGYKNDEKYRSAIIDIKTLPTINADISAMRQLFGNLITNALKYQPLGNVPVIKITAADQGDKWLFKIADNGIGIDPKHYDKIFAIFKRLHNKSAYSGTGIGLATCKKIVDLYHGNIWIEPNDTTGSIFCFTMLK